MNHIEDDLRNALRRKPAPPGLGAKIFEQVKGGSIEGNMPKRYRTNRYRILAAAAAVIMAVGAGIFAHRHYVAARNEAALHRTLTALSIVSKQFDRAETEAFASRRWERVGKQLADLAASEKN